MDGTNTIIQEVVNDQASADNFLFALLKAYAVASMGWWIVNAIDRLGSTKPDGVQNTYIDPVTSESNSEDTDTDTDGGELSDSNKPATDVLFPLTDVAHDISAEVEGAFCIYHYTQPTVSEPWYIIMMYDSKSSSFTYWCDQTPSWDILQTTARKFVTENRCSALYACANVTTETESSDNESNETTNAQSEIARDSGPNNVTTIDPPALEKDEPQSLTTRIENVYVKIGRVSHFRTPEKAPPKNSEVNYRNFAVMRNRVGGKTSTSL